MERSPDGRSSRSARTGLAVRGDPLPVVLADEMQVRAGGLPPFTRGMPDAIILLEVCALLHHSHGRNVQIDESPSGLFEAISVKILYNSATFGAHNHSIGGCRNPGRCSVATTVVREGGEVNCGQRAIMFPGTVWAASVAPRNAWRERQRQFRLRQTLG